MKKILAFFAATLLLFGGCTTPIPTTSIGSEVEKYGDIDSPQKALVIGNSEYVYGKLFSPTNDADDISNTLQGMGFYVVKATNLKLSEMKRVITNFEKTLVKNNSGNDVALFYFSGHGAGVNTDGNSEGNYLIPVNNDIENEHEVPDRAIRADTILTAMITSNRSGVNLMMLDACRDKPYRSRSKSRSRGMFPTPSINGTVQAYATAFGEIAIDDSGRNSLYTKHLVNTLETAKKRPIEIEDVLVRVAYLVGEESDKKQKPDYNYSVKGGKICLGYKDCKQPI